MPPLDDLDQIATDMMTKSQTYFKAKYSVEGPFVQAQLDCGAQHYKKLKQFVYAYNTSRSEIVQ